MLCPDGSCPLVNVGSLGAPDYLVIGHLTRDRLAGGADAPGGTARYAALAAARLGLHAAVLTAGGPTVVDDLPAEIAAAVSPSDATTTFENRYSPLGRRQWLHAQAAPISFETAPPAWRAAPIIHLAPLAAELDLAQALAWAAPGSLVGLTPQGWMRAWDPPLPAPVRPATWRPDPALLRRVALLVLSIEDVGGDEALAASYAAACPLVVVTRAAAGATLYSAGRPWHVAPFPAHEASPTGAGDVFAAAMLVRLHETGDAQQAATFASAAAALAVEGPGLGRLSGRAAIERTQGRQDSLASP